MSVSCVLGQTGSNPACLLGTIVPNGQSVTSTLCRFVPEKSCTDFRPVNERNLVPVLPGGPQILSYSIWFMT